jgi:ribosomal protein L27
MARKGGISSKFYRETRGMKVSGGQAVKAGTVLTREGDHWKPGLFVTGLTSLTAAVEGEVYFTRKRNRFKKVKTYINIRPAGSKAK